MKWVDVMDLDTGHVTSVSGVLSVLVPGVSAAHNFEVVQHHKDSEN